jgi:hypothetical protein
MQSDRFRNCEVKAEVIRYHGVSRFISRLHMLLLRKGLLMQIQKIKGQA